jgi:HlyD family secretion protein
MEYQDQYARFKIGLTETHDQLAAEIAQWEQTFVLKAPKDGVVSFSRFWSEDQNVTEGDVVLSVVPENPGNLIGKMDLSIRRSGKVETGHAVHIKVDNYPYMEYGLVEGTIQSISLVPTDQYYAVEIALPEELQTNYGRSLEFDQEMSGMAEIITEERRLITRIIDPFKYILEKNL